MTQPVADMLDRARHARSLRIRYELGRGGRDPDTMSPADAEGRCDCSGFTAWAHRIDRRQVVNGDEVWLGTGGLIADAHRCDPAPAGEQSPCPECGNKQRAARGDRRWYTEIDRPELGALLVYAADKQAGRPYGHVGIVTGGLPAEWDPRSLALWRALRVTHCHGPRGLVPSIDETGAMIWARHWGQRRGTVFVRRVG